MPYIKKEERPRYDELIEQITTALVEKLPAENGKGFSEGDLNYVISSIVWNLFDKKPSYSVGNKLVGVIDCVKQEFYRRKLAPYEDGAIERNGDICLKS
jgi:hypothetical protein